LCAVIEVVDEPEPEPILPGKEPSENAGGKWGFRAIVGARLCRMIPCEDRKDWLFVISFFRVDGQ
jgi:hypothetical protein